MDGDGGGPGEEPFDLGTVLTQLNDQDPETRTAAVETIRSAVDEEPVACLPTVPMLRGLLGESTPTLDADVAYCLERLAAESPDDVAPSVSAIVDFLATDPPGETTELLLACLDHVADERPRIVADELADVTIPRPDGEATATDALEQRRPDGSAGDGGPTADRVLEVPQRE